MPIHDISLLRSRIQTEIFTLTWHSPAMKFKKTVANIFQWKTPVTWPKNWHWFFDFLGVICHLSINIRIEVHFLFAFENERTLVACKSLRSAWRFTRFTRDQCPFISQCKQKKRTSILKIMLTLKLVRTQINLRSSKALSYIGNKVRNLIPSDC